MSAPHIIVVDDDPAYLFFAELALENEFRLTTIERSETAAQQIVELAPDIVLLDLMMPLVDGMGVCRQLVDVDPTLLRRIVINTANPSNPLCEELMQMGVHAVIMKLANEQGMRELLAHLLEDIRATSQNPESISSAAQ